MSSKLRDHIANKKSISVSVALSEIELYGESAIKLLAEHSNLVQRDTYELGRRIHLFPSCRDIVEAFAKHVLLLSSDNLYHHLETESPHVYDQKESIQFRAEVIYKSRRGSQLHSKFLTFVLPSQPDDGYAVLLHACFDALMLQKDVRESEILGCWRQLEIQRVYSSNRKRYLPSELYSTDSKSANTQFTLEVGMEEDPYFNSTLYVSISHKKSKPILVPCLPTDSVESLKTSISTELEINNNRIRIYGRKSAIPIRGKLFDHVTRSSQDTNCFQLCVDDETFEFEVTILPLEMERQKLVVDVNTTVYSLKCLYSSDKPFEPDALRFVYQGRQLEDDDLLTYYDIHSDSVIHMIFRLRGS